MYHEESNRFSFGHLAIAFVTGALTAVAATLLTTPYTGRESRQYLRRFAVKSKDMFAKAPGAIRGLTGKAKPKMDEYLEDIGERIGR